MTKPPVPHGGYEVIGLRRIDAGAVGPLVGVGEVTSAVDREREGGGIARLHRLQEDHDMQPVAVGRHAQLAQVGGVVPVPRVVGRIAVVALRWGEGAAESRPVDRLVEVGAVVVVEPVVVDQLAVRHAGLARQHRRLAGPVGQLPVRPVWARGRRRPGRNGHDRERNQYSRSYATPVHRSPRERKQRDLSARRAKVRFSGWGAQLSERQKRLTLIACIMGSAIVFIDGTVVNVALPAIREDLDASLADQQWIVEAYLLTLGSLILIGGSLSDLFGRRRVFALGTALFGLTSFLCAIAPSSELLIAARGLQGIAGALLVPSTLATIVAVFPEAERGRAIGTWTAWSGVSTVIGPLAGGALIDSASWRWIFALNLLPVAATLYLIVTALPESLDERQEDRHVDVRGAILCALGLAGPVFALIEQPRYGWSDPIVLVPFFAGLVFLAAFIVQERRSPEPMLPLDLFKRRNFAVANLATLVIYAGLGAALFFLTLFLQETAGYSAIEAGIALLPLTVMLFFLSSRFGALADRLGPRFFMSVGPLIAGVGLLLLMAVDRDADYVTQILPAILAVRLRPRDDGRAADRDRAG